MSGMNFDFPEFEESEPLELLQNSINTNNLSFNDYTSKVYSNLNALENEIINELVSNDKELIAMLNSFNESEKILNSIENSLMTYKEKLSGINSEMKLLQVKSQEISTKLNNRKELEEELFKLLDSIVLAPEFLNDLINKDIEDEFISKLAKLDEKLEIFIQGDLPESKAVEEIIPEMQKTLAKVCSKIYIHIVNKFQMFQKPNTNIQTLQSAIFLKMKPLISFIKKHAVVMYNDLVSKYVSTMEKIYSSGAQSYTYDIGSFVNEKFEKISLISSEDIPKDLIGVIDKRIIDIISSINENSIIVILAQQKQLKYYYEEILRSLNKFIMDILVSELIFFDDFFILPPNKSSGKLNDILKTSINIISEFVKKLILKTNDFVSISLMILINYEQSKIMYDQNIMHLEYYFESINTFLWPKFDQLFAKYTDYFFKQNPKNSKMINNGLHVVTNKLGEFMSLINCLCKHTTQSPMLNSRIKQIQKQFNQFYSEASDNSKLLGLEREEINCVFFINNLYYILKRLEGFDDVYSSNDPESFNKVFQNKTESYCSILFKKYFDEIEKILNTCLLMEKKELTGEDYTYNKLEIEKLNKKNLKIITVNFNNKYKELLEFSKKSVNDNIKNRENSKEIFKKFLQEVVVLKYFHFLEILRISENEDLITVSYQKFIIEINNIVKSL